MLALALPVLAVSFAVIVALVERADYHRQQAELRREIERTARVNGQVLAGSIWYVNVGSLTAGLEVVVQHDDVVAVAARDADRTMLAWSIKAPGDQIRSGQGVGPPGVEGAGWSSVVEPVYLEHLGLRQEAGELELYYTAERIDAMLFRRLALDAVLFLLLVLCLVGSVVLVSQRAVAAPLAQWRAALVRDDAERLPTVDWSSADEIGEVVRLYNERVEAENTERAELELRVRLFEDAVGSLRRGFCIFDRDFRLVSFNRRFVEILGHQADAIKTGMSLSALLRANAAKGEYGSASVDAVIIDRLAIAASNQPFNRERVRPDGTTIEVESTPLPGGGFVSIYTDVTPQKTLEAQMRHMALNDTVTGLPNRALFHDRLGQALALTDRLETSLALMLIDIDHFRQVNDAHGHEVGDGVLKELADRLRRIVRHSDTLARLDGDRFAITQQPPSIDDAALLAHRILGTVSRAFEFGELALRLTVSIGITVYPDDDRVSRNILRNAQLALAAAKAEGRHRYRFFKPELDRAVARRRRLEEEIFNGLREGQFVLHFQPRVELETGALAAVEALVRWQHPERGLLLPADFFDLAEDRGLIVPLTEWALEEAGRWRRECPAPAGEDGWRVAVPLSPRHFQEVDVAASVDAALGKSALEPRLLEVEVAAESILRQTERVTAGLHALRERGVAALLVGFGSGAVPLSLQELPVDGIRLGRELVNGLAGEAGAVAAIQAAVCLGQQLRLRVTADGVEDPEVLRRLREEGCAEAQGDAVSPPLTAEEMARWLERAAARAPRPEEPTSGR